MNAIYLLVLASSATSLVCFIIGISFLLLRKWLATFTNAKQLIFAGLAVVAFLTDVNEALDLEVIA